MKKQKVAIGAILEIKVNDEYSCYAQILPHGLLAFFDYKTSESLKDFTVLKDCPVLFILTVYKDVITKGHWLKVGTLDVRPEFNNPPLQFVQDKLSPEDFSLYEPMTGEIIATTMDKIVGLERASVWEAHHVEDRLRDHYLGVPCVWLEEDANLFESISKQL